MQTLDAADLPPDWRRTPLAPGLQEIGKGWLEAASTAVLQVPSAIVPIECNYLLNPLHPDFRQVRIHDAEPFEIDRRLLRPTT